MWGNFLFGVVYKVEGVDIFNFFYFVILGSMGGLVLIINNKFFVNFDFLMFVFFVEYGNLLLGIFDLKL